MREKPIEEMTENERLMLGMKLMNKLMLMILNDEVVIRRVKPKKKEHEPLRSLAPGEVCRRLREHPRFNEIVTQLEAEE